MCSERKVIMRKSFKNLINLPHQFYSNQNMYVEVYYDRYVK